MQNIEGTKIWYFHQNLITKIEGAEFQQFSYSYRYDGLKGGMIACGMISRELRDLKIVNNCIFDTPDSFSGGRGPYLKDNNQFRLQEYAYYYAAKADKLPPEFFENLYLFTSTIVKPTEYNLHETLKLRQEDPRFQKVSSIQLCIYISQLRKHLKLATYYPYPISIYQLKNTYKDFCSLSPLHREDFAAGLGRCLDSGNIWPYLALQKGYLELLDSIKLTIPVYAPQRAAVEAVQFENISENLRKYIFETLTSTSNVTISQVVLYAKQIRPPEDFVYQALIRLYSRKYTYNYNSNQGGSTQIKDNNSDEKYLKDFFLSQNRVNQTALIKKTQFWSVITKNSGDDKFLAQVFDLFQSKEFNDGFNNESFESIKEFMNLILKFNDNDQLLNYIQRFLLVLDALPAGRTDASNILVGDFFSRIRKNKSIKQKFEEILLNCDIEFNSPFLYGVIVQGMHNEFRNLQGTKEKYIEQLKVLASSKLVAKLLQKNLEGEIIKIFDMGISFIENNGNELELIKDQNFIEIFKILIDAGLIDKCPQALRIKCVISNYVLDIFEETILIKDLHVVLTLDQKYLVNFAKILGVKELTEKDYKQLNDMFEESECKLTGYKEFAHLMKLHGIQGHEEIKEMIESINKQKCNMTLGEFKTKDLSQNLAYMPSSYHFLYYLAHNNFVFNNLNSHIEQWISVDPIVTREELDQAIMAFKGLLQKHIILHKTYGAEGEDKLTNGETILFWHKILQVNQIKKIDQIKKELERIRQYFLKIYDEDEQEKLKYEFNYNQNTFVQDIANTSYLFKRESTIKNMLSAAKNLRLDHVFQESTKLLTENYENIINLKIKFEQQENLFKITAQNLQTDISALDDLLQENNIEELQNISDALGQTFGLIEYLRELASQKIVLEDLVDVIDDCSGETDALIYDLMEARNALQFICEGGSQLDLISCLVERWQNYLNFTKKNQQKIKTIIGKCSDNLQMIKAKIANQNDRSSKTLQIFKNLKRHLIVEISISHDEKIQDNTSSLYFKTNDDLGCSNEKMSSSDLTLLCNRYKLIASSNKKTKNHKQDIRNIDLDNIDQEILEINQLANEIRYYFENLDNQGHPVYQELTEVFQGPVNVVLPVIREKAQELKNLHREYIEELNYAKQVYPCLNLLPKSTFKLINQIMSVEDLQESSQAKQDIQKLLKVVKFINPQREPQIENFLEFIKNEGPKLSGYELYGQVVQQLIDIPDVQIFEAQENQMDEIFAFQDRIQCRKIRQTNQIWMSILSLFLKCKQIPYSWQIFFCEQNTKGYELENFARLAMNFSVISEAKEVAPLFLVVGFEQLTFQLQRQLVEVTENLQGELNSYREEEDKILLKIKLVISYFGNYNQNLHILQRFKEAQDIELVDNATLNAFFDLRIFGNVHLYESSSSGLGKTYQIKKQCSQQRLKCVEIPLYSETSKLELIKQFQNKIGEADIESGQYALHLNLHPMRHENIDIVLFQILLLRKISQSQGSFFSVNNEVKIYVEIQNQFRNVFQEELYYLKEYIPPRNISHIKTKKVNIQQISVNIPDMALFDFENNPNFDIQEVQISFQYLKKFENRAQFDTFFPAQDTANFDEHQISQEDMIQLINQYLLSQIRDKSNLSFYHMTSILTFFFKQVINFHNTPYFSLSNLQLQEIDKRIRSDVFQSIIYTVVPYSCQLNSNNFNDQANLTYDQAIEQRKANISRWDDDLGNGNDFFLAVSHNGNPVPIYKNLKSVPKFFRNYYKNVAGEELKEWDAVTNDQNYLRDKVLMNLCTPASQERQTERVLEQEYKDIALTKTIARKICFLYLKLNANIPVLIMGETGVGKTILVKYLAQLINGCMYTFNVHAGQTQEDIYLWVKEIIDWHKKSDEDLLDEIDKYVRMKGKNAEEDTFDQKIKALQRLIEVRSNYSEDHFANQKVIVFFDEINTNQNVDGILKELLIDKKLNGEPLPQDFVTIAAANPYIFKSLKDQLGNTDSLRITACENSQASKLVYHVHPLAESMNTFIFDFGTLQDEDETKIINKMVQILNNHETVKGRLTHFQMTISQTIKQSQIFTKEEQSIRSVSLRDVARFLKVYQYFLADSTWNKDIYDALLLSVFYSYYCRFNSLDLRNKFCRALDAPDGVTLAEGRRPFENNTFKIVDEQMEKISQIIEHGDTYKMIAYTSTLKENIFMTMISVLNRIPIIIVGPPGSSKTFCVNLLYDSMKGKNSKIQFFRSLPNLLYKTYQCSALSTPESLEKAFKLAKQLENTTSEKLNQEESQKSLIALILDEIGLAEASPSNPLKVLHKILEDKSQVPMIGLSNWSLDSSKMNRVVFANRPKLTIDELLEAAAKMKSRIFSDFDDSILSRLAEDSFYYFQNNNNLNQEQQRIMRVKGFFHGTRDFYNCVQQICLNMRDNSHRLTENLTQEIVLTAILRNFGGKEDVLQTLKQFQLTLGDNIEEYYCQNIKKFNSISLIKMNIADYSSRNLMIIVDNFEIALQYIQTLCSNKQTKIFLGSDLRDEFSQQNALKMINEIMTCMEEGYLIQMYGVEILYQSLYDLLNKNYKEMGSDKLCRIAIGSDSIRARVHNNFKAIVIAEKKDVYNVDSQRYDPPLLNRFEKQFLDFKSLLDLEYRHVNQRIKIFIDDFSGIENPPQKKQNIKKICFKFDEKDAFPLMKKESVNEAIYSLIINKQNKNLDEQGNIQIFVKSLIDLACLSGIIRASLFQKITHLELQSYLESVYHFDFNRLIYSLLTQDVKDEDDQLQQIIEEDDEQNKDKKNNFVIYTPNFEADQDDDIYAYCSLVESVGLNSVLDLKEQLDQFVLDQDKKIFILLSNFEESRTKILHIKKQISEQRQQLKIGNKNMQNKYFIMVVQTTNKNNQYSGITQESGWEQIYMESTKGIQGEEDDVQSYLHPIEQLCYIQNSIFTNLVAKNSSKILKNINYDEKRFNDNHIVQRIKIFQDFLNNVYVGKEIKEYIKLEVIKNIDKLSNQYQQIIGQKCEWYHIVSLQEEENREHNTFLSHLQDFLDKQVFTIVQSLYLQSEQNNLISSFISNQDLFLNNRSNVQNIWNYLKQECLNKKIQNLESISKMEIDYPFYYQIKEQIETIKVQFSESKENLFLLEERMRIRNNGADQEEEEHKQDDQQIYQSNLGEEDEEPQLNKEQICEEAPTQQKKKKKEQSQNLSSESYRDFCNVDINNMLYHIMDEKLFKIANILPSQYFGNLKHESLYTSAEGFVAQQLIQTIANQLSSKDGNTSVGQYYAVLWTNEDIIFNLQEIWQQVHNFDREFTVFQIRQLKENISLIFQQPEEQSQQNQEQNLNHSQNEQNSEQEVCSNGSEALQGDNYFINTIEKIWKEIIIFTSELLDSFISPSDETNQIQQNRHPASQWKTNLRSCIGILNSYIDTIGFYSQELSEQMQTSNMKMLKFYFVLQISDSFVDQNEFKKILKEQIKEGEEFSLINPRNYSDWRSLISTDVVLETHKPKTILLIIWQILKCDEFQEDFETFDEGILGDIISQIRVIIKKIDYSDINSNQIYQGLHSLVQKSIQKIIQNAFSEFDINEYIKNPIYNNSITKLSNIFIQQDIKLDEAVVSIFADQIQNIENIQGNQILGIVAELDQDNEEEKDEKRGLLQRFMVECFQQPKETLLQIVDAQIMKQICHKVSFYLYFSYNKRNNLRSVHTINQVDLIGYQKLRAIVNAVMKYELKYQHSTPLISMYMVKVLTKYGFSDIHKNLKDEMDVFNEKQIFLENKINENIWDNEIQDFIEAFRQDMIDDPVSDKPKLQEVINGTVNDGLIYFALTSLISEVLLTNKQAATNKMIMILAYIRPMVIDLERIRNIGNIYQNLKKDNQEASQGLMKSFVYILVSTIFLDNKSIFQRLLQHKESVNNIYLPFLVDSDEILEVWQQLRSTTAIRRYECKKCTLKGFKPHIWSVPPCCMPASTMKCPTCQSIPVVQSHFSDDLVPPITSYGKQEPIFVKEINHYGGYASYYGQPGFPYSHDVQIIDDFIGKRGRISKGLQMFFGVNESKKMRNTENIFEILIGRIYTLSIVCLYVDGLRIQEGAEKTLEEIGVGSLNDVFPLIFESERVLTAQKQKIAATAPWNVLSQQVDQQDESIFNFIVRGILFDQKGRIKDDESPCFQSFLQDAHRVQYEQQFFSSVRDHLTSQGIKKSTEQFKIQQQNQNELQQIILFGKFKEVESLSQYSNLLRLSQCLSFQAFYNDLQYKAKGKEPDLLKKLIEYKSQIGILSKIYPLQNWIKAFNEKAFLKITEAESQEIKIKDFNQKHGLSSEFKLLVPAWKSFEKLLHTDEIQLGECQKIVLDNIEDPNSRIAIFCQKNNEGRGWPLYLLMEYLKKQHNNFLGTIESQFENQMGRLKEKRFINFTQNNFMPDFILNEDSQFFKNHIVKYLSPNPLYEFENDVICDYQEMTQELIEQTFSQVMLIQEPNEQDTDRIQMKEFKFIGDSSDTVTQISEKIPQEKYPYIQENILSPLQYIRLENNDVRMNFYQLFELAFSIINKINIPAEKNETLLGKFLEDFRIQIPENIDLKREQIKLRHLQHVYELIEKMSLDFILNKINNKYAAKLSKSQQEELDTFCNTISIKDLQIFYLAIGRMCARLFCQTDCRVSPQELIFKCLCDEYAGDSFRIFWGIEHHSITFNQQILESDWRLNYKVFGSENADQKVITFAQSFHLYRNLKTNHKQRMEKQAQEKQKKEEQNLNDIKRQEAEINNDEVFSPHIKIEIFNKQVAGLAPQAKKKVKKFDPR